MSWVRAFHIIFMVTWFAGLFYLPRLFVYHAMCEGEDRIGAERFKIMERKLYFGIMTPGAVLTIVFGLWLLFAYAWQAYRHEWWLYAKLALVVVLVGYHLYCGRLLNALKHDRNTHSHVFYRWLNEAPVLLLIAITILVVVKPN
jgi:putative membrane protein